MGQLEPDFAGERGFGTGSEDEKADWWRVGAETFDVGSCTGFGWVESISEGYDVVSMISLFNSVTCLLPEKDLSPSAVRRPSDFMLYGESSCKTLAMVAG